MNDDRMDEQLVESARDYNTPGPVPRDEMWARIDAARRARLTAGPVPSARRHWRWVVSGIAAAALLAAGIAIGRRLEHAGSFAASPIARVPGAASRPESIAATRSTPAATPRDSMVVALRTETRRTDERARQLAENASGPSTESDNLAYRLVLLRHLSGSEAMITAFRSSARHGQVDSAMADWARELLGTTRMLEASPVAQDPTMKRLLDDLDLVIVQIARYATSGTSNPDDLDLIEQSINKRGVLTKLRSTARALPAGT